VTITSPAPPAPTVRPPSTHPPTPRPPDHPAGASRWRPGRRWIAGNPEDPRWARPGLLGLLTATGLLYILNLAASGYANAYYSAAVQAGSTSWKAFFFGSFDAGNAITVDKPPASLWIQDIAARIFGVNSWSLLVPEALMGVAAVGLLYATVRRRFGPAAGLLAGAALATTPVATLMFRFNNPDALMVLLLVAGAYALTRALEKAQTRWMVLTGTLIGFAFLAKMMQAFLVVPGFAIVYLIAAPTSLRRRIVQMLYGGVAMLVAAGWWVAIVSLIPAGDRPYIGGSQNNSLWDLIWGYNGLGRLSGNETGSVGGGATTGGSWGATGFGRLFNSEIGGQISWLIPTALLFLVSLLWLSRRAPRTDGRRAALMIWGSWLVITGVTFSLMAGIFHAYYTVALAPAMAALVGIGGVALWQHRHQLAARLVLASGIALATGWSFVLLERTSSWNPWMRYVVLLAGLAATVIVAALPRLTRSLALGAATLAIVAGLLGPFGYSVATAATGKSGSIPTAGPTVAGAMGGPGGTRMGGMRPGGFTGQAPTGTAPRATTNGRTATNGMTGGMQAGGMGGLLNATTPSSALTSLLLSNASDYTWVAAAVGSNNAAGIQLATGKAVMAIGGFNGTDPSPTLAEFKALVAAGKIHYFIGGSSVGGSTSGTSSAIASWVAATFTAKTVGGETVYDLTAPTSG